MFGSLAEKFQEICSTLSGNKTLTEENVSDAARQVRLALLDADVNYSVASQFVKKVKEKALGERVLKSVLPPQQFISMIHDELVSLMGSEESTLEIKGSPSVLLLCGLQGSGKTTQCAKLSYLLKKRYPQKKILLVACDLQRAAAVEQLQTLGLSIDVPVHANKDLSPLQVAQEAVQRAKREGFDIVILDTAGRLHVDEALMLELQEIKSAVNPDEVLFVASAATGQDAVKTAAEFDRCVGISGVILTMLDGSSRAGCAISIREVIGKPLKFEGIGEKVGDLQPFNPRSMADRILGMGDVINLVRKAKETIDEKESEALEKKLLKATFTYEDYLKQMSMFRKMGPLKGLLKMMPGMGDFDLDEKELNQIEAIIYSMSPEERQEKVELLPGRRRRIAQGSGTSMDAVNRLVKGFKQIKTLFKSMPNMKQQMKKGKNPLESLPLGGKLPSSFNDFFK